MERLLFFKNPEITEISGLMSKYGMFREKTISEPFPSP